MKVLIIEDDINKLKAISDFLSTYDGIQHSSKTSYHSGVQALLSESYDCLLLDMSMPTYDVTVREPGGRLLALAGRDILFQLRRRNISLRTIVITQYEEFGGKSLSELDKEFQAEFPQQYTGFVYYNTTQDMWKEKLAVLLKQESSMGVEHYDLHSDC